MRLTTTVFIIPLFTVYTLAFSWRRQKPSSDIEYALPQDLAIPDIGLDKDAIGSVDGPYKRKPDCFRSAAARIRVRCAEIDMYADQRVKAAILMTLCELRTAEFHSIPLECEAFLEEGGLDDSAHHGICVEALSRSSQSWASYSGYLREIPQLCFTYQRSNEKDLALEIYRNATIEKIAYIRHLMQRAEKEVEARTLWQALLLDLQSSISNLQASPGLADKISNDISVRVLQELQQVMRTQKEVFDVQLQEHSLSLSEHSRTLMTLSSGFERSFSARLNAGLQPLEKRLGETLDASDKIWQQFSLMEGGLFSIMNSVAQLSMSVNHVSDALNSSARDLKLINIAQANAIRATDGLIVTLQQMNDTVISALIDINATAMSVNQTVGSYSIYSNFLSLAGAVIDLKQISPLRLVASTTVRLVWFILHHSSSFLAMPCIAAIISVLRWLIRKILAGQGLGSRPCMCRLRPSLESSQTLVAPISSVTLSTRATPWARRRPFGWRSSQFSRVPDRLCGRRLDD